MKLWKFTFFLFAALIAVSCASGPVEIPEDMTAAEMIQRAQEASDRNRYSVSLQYYETLIYRFPTDSDSVCAAEYEIAHIHFKEKRYAAAKIEFTDLLERYNTPDAELLPPQFKLLAENTLKRIAEIESAAEKGDSAS